MYGKAAMYGCVYASMNIVVIYIIYPAHMVGWDDVDVRMTMTVNIAVQSL